jgi:hypothetical protein
MVFFLLTHHTFPGEIANQDREMMKLNGMLVPNIHSVEEPTSFEETWNTH